MSSVPVPIQPTLTAEGILETASGFSTTNVALWSRHHDDPGCLHGSNEIFEDARLAKTTTGRDVLIVRVVQKDLYWMLIDPAAHAVIVAEHAYACHVDDKGAASCEGPVVTALAHPALPANFDPGKAQFYAIDVATTPWLFRKEPILGPAGDLRVGP
jgi:hypothetical protein